jgi:hypothetical protein
MKTEEIVQQIYKQRHPEEVFFRELVSKFEIKLSGDYPNSIFYMIDDKIYMDQDKKTKLIWIRYDGFWSVFVSEFGYNWQETKELLKGMLERYLKIEGYTPKEDYITYIKMLERYLKIEGYTPFSSRR